MSFQLAIKSTGACLLALFTIFISTSVPAFGQSAVTVSLPSVNAVRGETVTIPVTVGDLTGKAVSSYDFTLNYDATKLTPAGGSACTGNACYSTTGTLSSAMSITANAGTSGKVIISAFGTGNLTGSGTLINLIFTVNSTASGVAALTWQAFVFNEGTPSATTSGGSVTIPAFQKPVADFNGDGKTDFAVTRDNAGLKSWWVLVNGTSNLIGSQWGVAGADRATPADFDGDGKADIAVWREEASGQGNYYIFRSSDNTVLIENFGLTGDDPSVTADYDGDGKADPAVFRCPSGSAGQCFFFYRASNNNPSRGITYIPWGYGIRGTSIQPVKGDYDGDGKNDFCVFVDGGSGKGLFILLKSSNAGVEYVQWGLSTDDVIPGGDFDGDGRTDFALARLVGSNYNIYTLTRSGGGTGASPYLWGVDGDNAAFGDYDGDGKTDIALWRSTNAVFYIIKSSDGSFLGLQWGRTGDSPVAEWIFPRN